MNVTLLLQAHKSEYLFQQKCHVSYGVFIRQPIGAWRNQQHRLKPIKQCRPLQLRPHHVRRESANRRRQPLSGFDLRSLSFDQAFEHGWGPNHAQHFRSCG